MKLVFAVCGSFCTHAKALVQLRQLAASHEITPVLSEISASADTRFGTADALRREVEEITGRIPLLTIPEAEATVTRGGYDALIVCPCTGNTLAKIASGVTDSVVTMCVKAQLRNRRPVVLALATNDGLSANLFNLAVALEKKHIFLVPFGQDDPEKKPTSLICEFAKLPETLEAAMHGKQIQPILSD